MGIAGMYENHTDGHDKFWELKKVTVGTYEARWGKCGSEGQGPKVYVESEAERVVAQKLKKGYVKV